MKTIILFIILLTILPSCSLLQNLFINPDTIVVDEFERVTDHEMLRIFPKEDRLGYICENGFYTKKVWGGRIAKQHTGQTKKVIYEGRAFDEVKAILNSSFRVGPSLENAHSIYLFLEDITKYELIDPQPLIEYMSPDNTELLQKPFVYSMIKVSKMSIQTRKQITGGVNAEYELSPKIAVTAGTGVGTEHTSEDAGYNVFVGQKFMEGAQWVDNFHDAPKVDIVLIKPLKDAVIDQVQARVQGHILQYHLIPENFQNKLQLYIMVQNEYEDDWILQSKARVDMNGYFEAILKLGTLEEGNGHRYSISAFATYFKINREVNSTIPFLPFNKGQYIINVKRQDRDF